ncbi:MAG TPA: hypothetical protein VGQ09_01100 [Chitinophagaceae bacterium]|jgi:uncharacterized lipoprotein YajG|nr:hypothetical protein [Chitinophagaceae bacterium]
MIKYISLIIISFIFFVACKKSSETTQTTQPPLDCSTPKSFSAHVLPITSANCAISGCHGSGSNNGPGQLITYQQIFNSRAIIRSAVASGLMPQGSRLSEAEVNTILCWIDNGAPNN